MRRFLVPVLAAVVAGCDSNPVGPPRPPNAVDVTMAFCLGDAPSWFAYKNEGVDWVRLSGISFFQESVTFPATPRLTIATAFSEPFFGSSDVHVYNVTAGEVGQFACTRPAFPVGSNRMGGSVKRISDGDAIEVMMGLALDVLFFGETSYTMAGLTEGPLDLVVVLQPDFQQSAREQLIVVRHNVSVANLGTIPLVDFTSVEAKPFAKSDVTVQGISPNAFLSGGTEYRSARGTNSFLASFFAFGTQVTIPSVDPLQLATGDLHRVAISASFNGDGHEIIYFQHAPGSMTISAGPVISAPTLDTLSTTPAFRPRVRVASQSAYPAFAEVTFSQNNSTVFRTVSVMTTAAFTNGAPPTWELGVPDLSAVSGFQNDWSLKAGISTTWSVAVRDAPLSLYFGRTAPAEGDVMRSAFHVTAP